MILTVLALSFAAGAASDCAQDCKQPLVHIAPAEMLDLEDRFREGLPSRDRARLDHALPRAADGRIAQCDGRDGAACDAMAYLAAFKAVGMMPAFLATICPRRT